jgi:D-alanyl-D-alanine carboxypeptidase/D-alanyl-D-alanine-endopeptidase (penicillin-binding protein 4)
MLKLSVLFGACFLSCAVLAQNTLPGNIADALKKGDLPPSALSILVMPASAGAPALSYNADSPVSPASIMKLMTTLIALDELGPVFKWKTQMLSNGAIKNSNLRGDLYLRGGGDPNLTWDKLSLMLRSLRTLGVRKIAGDIVLDRSYFLPNRPDLAAVAFDENPDAYYNVIPDALMVHSNITAFQIDSSASEIRAEMLTPMSKLRIRNDLRLDNRACADWEAQWLPPAYAETANHGLEITLSGNFPRLCKITTYLSFLDRNLYIEHLIRALWSEMGGVWNGKIKDGVTPEDAVVLLERPSESMADTIKIINKQSDNTMARTLLLTLGAESPDAKLFADTLQAADARIRLWFARHQISSAGLVLENGSGLSRLERITPLQLASVLRVGARSDWFAEYASSMPIVGVDGTMRKRLKGGIVEGRARIKTGYLKNVTAVAGYVRDKDDVNWIVIGIINADKASRGRPVLDELIGWVAAGRPL